MTQRRNEKSLIVATSGCFDIIHPGHVRLFEYMREFAGPYGSVVVFLNVDEYIRDIKGHEPRMSYEERKEVLKALRAIDLVLPLRQPTPELMIQLLHPDVWVKGCDYGRDIPETLTVESYGGKVHFVNVGYERHSGDIVGVRHGKTG